MAKVAAQCHQQFQALFAGPCNVICDGCCCTRELCQRWVPRLVWNHEYRAGQRIELQLQAQAVAKGF